jgi:hypothetical protein
VGEIEPVQHAEFVSASAARKWSPEMAPASFTAAVHDGELWEPSYRLRKDELNGSRGAQDQPESDELVNWGDGDRR